MAIEIKPLYDESLIDFYFQKQLNITENCGCVVAKNGDEFLGYCAYVLDKQSITITALAEFSDLFMADGILRSALHVADYRGITKAFYTKDAPGELFKKLDFIKNEQENTLKIEKLHQKCCGC